MVDTGLGREKETPNFIYSFIYNLFPDPIWSPSRAGVWTAAAETDAWPLCGSFIEKFQNNTASTSPFVSASKDLKNHISSASAIMRENLV